jgi:hypothetical protein
MILPRRSRSAEPPRAAPGRVRPAEWLFPLLLAGVLLLVVWIPYRDAYKRSLPSRPFMGMVGTSAIDDNNVYLGLMRQAADGRSLFSNNFTPEPNPPRLFNILYLFLGRVSHWTGWSLDQTHRLFMILSTLLLILAVYAFIAAGIRRPRYRRFALVIACLGGGYPFLAGMALRLAGLNLRPISSWLVEVNLFHAMLVYPHFVFAAALLTGALALLLKAERARRFGPAIAGGCAVAVLAASHAFEAVVAIPAALLYLGVDSLAPGRPPSANRWKCALLVAGIPVPMMILNQWILSREPMWGDVVRRLDFYTPDPFRLVMALGMSFAITVLTFDGLLRRDRPAGERMAKVWLLTSLALAYTPWINWRWHLLNGIQIPLSVLATQGLRRTLFLRLRLWQRRRARRRDAPRMPLPSAVAVAMAGVLCACCLGSRNLLMHYRDEVTSVEYPTYLSSSELAALGFLGREISHDAVVFASYNTGNYIPRLAGLRVFLGEDKLTGRYPERISLVQEFFGGSESDAARLDLLRSNGIGYVFYGPEEKKLGHYDPTRASFLRPVFREGEVTVLKFEPPGVATAGAPPAGEASPAKGVASAGVQGSSR